MLKEIINYPIKLIDKVGGNIILNNINIILSLLYMFLLGASLILLICGIIYLIFQLFWILFIIILCTFLGFAILKGLGIIEIEEEE